MIRTCIVLPDETEIFSGEGTVDAVQSITLTECVNASQELTLGSVCANMLEATLITPGGGLSIAAGEEITAYTVDDGGARTKVGVFLTEKPTRPSPNKMVITAYDPIIRLDKDLSAWLEGLDGWPYRTLDFARMVAAECGLTLKNTSLLNGDYPIQKFSASGITGRRLMEWIGQISAKFCRATADGEIEFAWYTKKDSVHIAPYESDGYTPYCAGSLTYEDYEVTPIEKVQLRLTDSDVGAAYPQVAEGANTYIITGNYLLTSQDPQALETVAQGIYNAISDMRYTPCQVSVFAGVSLGAGDVVDITDHNGKTITACVMKRVRKGQKETISCTGSHRRDSSSAVNHETVESLSGKLFETQMSIDGLRLRASHLENTAEKTGEKVTQLELTAQGISTRVSEVNEALGQRVSSAETQITQNANAIALRATKTEVTAATKEAVDALQIGGCNLVQGTSDTWTDLSVGAWSGALYHRVNGVREYRHEYSQFGVKPGDWLTFGITLKAVNKRLAMRVDACPDKDSSGTIYYGKYIEVGEEGRSTVSVQVDENNPVLKVYIGTNGANSANTTEQYKAFKVEQGNKATAWMPAPEDMATLTEMESAIVQNAGDILLSVSKQYTTYGDLSAAKEDVKKTTDALSNELGELSKKVGLAVTADGVEILVEQKLENGSGKVVTGKGYTFDDDGLTVSDAGSNLKTQLTEDGMKVVAKADGTDVDMLTANAAGVDAQNLHATTYLIVGKNSRFEDYGESRTGCFWIGG